MRIRRSKPPEERFWKKVKKTNDCWVWTGYTDKKGYGKFNPGNKSCVRTHRYSYDLHFGPIPDDLFVLHKCDNPPCVNPEHLFPGTHQDNMDDMHSKGRHQVLSGEGVATSKLTNKHVEEIRLAYSSGNTTLKELGATYGVSESNISSIVRNKSWRYK